MVQVERTRAAQSLTASDEERAWTVLLDLAARASQGRPLVQDSAALSLVASRSRPLDAVATQLLSQFLPLVTGRDSAQLVVAHLGQSADGYAATFCGKNKFITGEEDIRYTHRMRALFDAVLVGASTVAVDDPLLTTRLVRGKSPVRVVLDPSARLSPDHQVFRDRAARTLIVTEPGRTPRLPDHVERVQLPRTAAGLDLVALLDALRARGLSRIFIEGGAVTIAHFLRAKLLHRLQLAVAPVNLGPGPKLPDHQLSPHTLLTLGRTRRFDLGRDTLYETELRERAPQLEAAAAASE
jgi:riboflavin-specific deaminase-like protein